MFNTTSDVTLNKTPELRVRLVPLNMFKPFSDLFANCGRCFFCESFFVIYMNISFHVYLCYAVLSGHSSLVITCSERADLLARLCVLFSCVFVTFSLMFWVWYVI